MPHTPDDVDQVLNEVENIANDTCGALTDQEIVDEVTGNGDAAAGSPDGEDLDEVTPTELIKKPCNFAQALIYMEELKLYASCSQGPGSDEMYTEMLKLQAAMIRVLPKQSCQIGHFVAKLISCFHLRPFGHHSSL